MLQRMAEWPARWRSCCAAVELRRRCRTRSRGHRQRRRAAMPKNQHRPGQASGARGLEWRSSRRDENGGNAIEMLDRLRSERQREQLRRLGNGRGRQQIHRRADRAVVVMVTGMPIGGEQPGVIRRRQSDRCLRRFARRTENVLTMDVAERQRQLHRQREQRQTAAEFPFRPHPTHYENSRFSDASAAAPHHGMTAARLRNASERGCARRRSEWRTLWQGSDSIRKDFEKPAKSACLWFCTRRHCARVPRHPCLPYPAGPIVML